MSWQEGQAAQYDFYVAELDKLLVELENTEQICATIDVAGMLTETRGYAGGIRALRNDLMNRARDLRRHDDVTVLPMSLTTRSVRAFVCGPDDIDESGGLGAMIWEWLVIALFVALAIVIAWLALEARLEKRERRADRRRSEDERRRSAQERMERRRRLGLDKEDT